MHALDHAMSAAVHCLLRKRFGDVCPAITRCLLLFLRFLWLLRDMES